MHPAARKMFEYSGHSKCRDRAHDLTRTAQREAQAAATSSSSTRTAFTGISNAARLLKVWKWLASKCVTEVNVSVAQGLYIHWSTVKHSAEKLQAASMKLEEGFRRVCSRKLWNIPGVTGTQSQTELASLARLHNNNATSLRVLRYAAIGNGRLAICSC